MNHWGWALGLLVSFLSAGSTAGASETLSVEVAAGKHDRQQTPLSLQIPAQLQDAQQFMLMRADTGAEVPIQKQAGDEPQLVWLLDEPLPAGETRRYRLAAREAAPSDSAKQSKLGVTLEERDGKLIAKAGGQVVMHYNLATVPSIDPQRPYFERSGYIHPLFNRAGQVVTGDMAADHAHQHGIMFAWVNTTFQGRQLDFWNSAKQQAKVEHVALVGTEEGPVFGQFVARLRHVDLIAPQGPIGVLNETWRVQIFNVADGFLFEIDSLQKCAGNEPLVINEYHYGGMALRGSNAWVGAEHGFLTPDHLDRKSGNQSRPGWCALSGKTDGETGGTLVMDHPQNFRHPQPVRLHPRYPYFVFAPSALGSFKIEPAKPYRSRYRYFVHTGELSRAEAERHWHDYTEPPVVRIVTP